MTSSRKIPILMLGLVGLWCMAFVAAPLLRLLEIPLATFLYSLFSEVCHQFPGRSLHLGGEPLAVCVRCSSIYFSVFASLFASLFIFRFVFDEYPPAWILTVAIMPMAVDVILNLTGIHSSSAWTRALSGAVAGLAIPFFVVPPLIEAVHQLTEKFGGLPHAGKTQ
ncbi:MAG: DUF2085 domain-containing protein [Bacteroidota bacterium]